MSTTTRAKFETVAENEIALTADFGRGIETRTYWHPSKGGYIREVTDLRPGTLGYQVCDGLAHTGSTLRADPGELAGIIRAAWEERRREMQRRGMGPYAPRVTAAEAAADACIDTELDQWIRAENARFRQEAAASL